MTTCLRGLLAIVVVLALSGCSDESEKPAADDTSTVASRPAEIPEDADGVVQSVDPRFGTAVVTDWDGVDHIVPDAGLEEATYVVLDDRVAYPVETRGGTSAGKVAPADGALTVTTEVGVVKWYREEQGYGFILRELGADVFFHQSAIVGVHTLHEGSRVVFDFVAGPKGPQAVLVEELS